jgi:hypothetical protein
MGGGNGMNIEKISNILGVASVIASLIFVGLELQQSQLIALAGQQQARTELNSNKLLTELELIGEIGPTAVTGGIEWEQMDAQQKVIREQIQRWYWMINENNFFQNEMGLLSEDIWMQVDRYIIGRYSECHLRHIYNAGGRYQPLVDYVNSLPDPCE